MAKAESALRPFGGQEDLEEFWQKFQVVGKIQKWTTAKDRMAHLPLYLAGDAFTVWRQIEESDQEDEDKVKARLEGRSHSPVQRGKHTRSLSVVGSGTMRRWTSTCPICAACSR